MMPSGHKAFVVNNVKDVELLLMHNKIYAAEYVLRSTSTCFLWYSHIWTYREEASSFMVT